MSEIEKGFKINVLDHGYVKLVDFMGSDESVIEAARISTGRGFVSWDPYKRCRKCDVLFKSHHGVHRDVLVTSEYQLLRISDKQLACDHDWESFPRGDDGILEYLYSEGHTSPFEMAEIILDVMVPMDVWRQWIRNRTANVNEYSTRYSPAIDEMAKTPHDEWRTQGKTNRQGSGEFLPDSVGVILSAREVALHDLARQVYEERLAAGVAKEQARKDLPLSNYTQARWKIDLHNLLHNFLGKRMHPHAQLEIRKYANAVAEITRGLWPHSYDLFEEWTLHGRSFSRTEVGLLRLLATADLKLLDAISRDHNISSDKINKLLKKLS